MIAENLSNRQYMLKYGINIKTNYIYKNFSEVLEAVGFPTRLYQSKSSKRIIVESLNEYTVYERIGQKWIFKENHYGDIKEFPELEEGEILHPYILSRIIAMTFIPNPDGKAEVNHKDENPKNDRVDNLEWMTRKENNNYGTRIQRASETRAKKHPGSGFNKGMSVSDEIKQKIAQTIKERYPEGWGSWNKGKTHRNKINAKEKAITKIKELILQYDISTEEIFN